MEITYEVTPDDVAAFAKFRSMSAWRQKTTWAGFLVLWIGASSFTAYRSWSSDPEPDFVSSLLVGLLMVGVFLVVFVFGIRALSIGTTRNAYRKDPGGTIGPASLTLDGESIRAANAAGYGSRLIPTLSGIEETPDHVFILLGPFMAYAIRRDSVTSGDLDAFVAELRKRMGEG